MDLSCLIQNKWMDGWITTLSAKKPVASTVVAMRFKQFVGMSSGLANMTKFKNI